MEIHKPKPIHNWREFLKEYAIIVLGVVTALAAEQGVEWLHWQGEVKAARQAMHVEMAANNTSQFSRRIAVAPCFARQAGEAERILDDLEVGRPPGRFANFRSSGNILIIDSEWQSQRSAQTLTHFPDEERALLGRYYDQKVRFGDWADSEIAAWQELGALRYPPKNIAAGDLLRLRTALGMVREQERAIVLNATRQLSLSRQLGVATVPYTQEEAEQFCAMDQNKYIQNALSHARQ